jgi:hypothetical protein
MAASFLNPTSTPAKRAAVSACRNDSAQTGRLGDGRALARRRMR